jgi:hypothetical protein
MTPSNDTGTETLAVAPCQLSAESISLDAVQLPEGRGEKFDLSLKGLEGMTVPLYCLGMAISTVQAKGWRLFGKVKVPKSLTEMSDARGNLIPLGESPLVITSYAFPEEVK